MIDIDFCQDFKEIIGKRHHAFWKWKGCEWWEVYQLQWDYVHLQQMFRHVRQFDLLYMRAISIEPGSSKLSHQLSCAGTRPGRPKKWKKNFNKNQCNADGMYMHRIGNVLDVFFMANSILEKVRVSTEVTFRSVIVEKRACVQSGNRMKSANRYHASDEPSRRTAEMCHKIPCDTEAVLAVVNTARSTSVSSQDGGPVDFIMWTVSCWGVSILTCFNNFQHKFARGHCWISQLHWKLKPQTPRPLQDAARLQSWPGCQLMSTLFVLERFELGFAKLMQTDVKTKSDSTQRSAIHYGLSFWWNEARAKPLYRDLVLDGISMENIVLICSDSILFSTWTIQGISPRYLSKMILQSHQVDGKQFFNSFELILLILVWTASVQVVETAIAPVTVGWNMVLPGGKAKAGAASSSRTQRRKPAIYPNISFEDL